MRQAPHPQTGSFRIPPLALGALLCVALQGAAGSDPASAPPPSEWHRGIFRVNTTVSAGDEDIEKVAQKASKAGLAFIVFSDQYLVRAQYGLPPFRNLLSITKERGSILSFGVRNYLEAIETAQERHPGIVLLPGADVAPYYYWTGNYLLGTLATNQFSEQLTVFGDLGPDFYRDIPVIHNERTSFGLRGLLGLWPLLITCIGLSLLLKKNEPYYADAQGNAYYGRGAILRRAGGALLAAVGLAWTADNRPFTQDLGVSPHGVKTHLPFQQTIDYVKATSGGKAGAIWSAPEATMKDKIDRVRLYTRPYLGDVEATSGHNGLAGIYADVSHAHEPGGSWDKMLLEYCAGTRADRPVIVGEADYHGRTPVDFIQTVVHAPGRLDRASLTDALVKGRSYGVATHERLRLNLLDVRISDTNGQAASLGETLTATPGAPLEFAVSGGLEAVGQGKRYPSSVILVLDGKELKRHSIDATKFELIERIEVDKGWRGLHYIRFYILTEGAGWLLSNPLFIDIK